MLAEHTANLLKKGSCRAEGLILSVVLDGAFVGEGAVVGAGAVVPPGARIEAGMMALGLPARVVRAVTDEERERHRKATLGYVDTARQHARADREGPDTPQ